MARRTVTGTKSTARVCGPVLPEPRGILSAAVLRTLTHRPPAAGLPVATARRADPYGEDLQLALYVCYELHYRSFADVDPDWEWEPGLLRLRGTMERTFDAALRADVPGGTGREDLDAELAALLVEQPGAHGVSHHFRREGTWQQMREFFAHRSIYQLKEADPQAWVIPRLEGRAKAALVAVEYDEFGAGRADRVHARLFAELMAEAGLDPSYGHYLDAAPAVTLATVNLMSYLGLHRARRGAMVGHFAAGEITTAPSARRIVQALDRLGSGPACRRFYTEHIEADAVHEQVLRHEAIGGLLADEPELTAEVVFGIQSAALLETRFGDHLLRQWNEGRSSLRAPMLQGGPSPSGA